MSTESPKVEPTGPPAVGGLTEEVKRQAEHAAAFKQKYRTLDTLFLVASIVLGAAATVVTGASAIAKNLNSTLPAKDVIDWAATICAAGATVSVTLHKTLKTSDLLSRGTACHAELASLRVELDDEKADRSALRKQYQHILTKYPEIIN